MTTEAPLAVVEDVKPKREIIPHVYQGEDDPVQLYMTTSAFDQLQRVATLMANSTLVPEHLLQGNLQQRISNCCQVVAQAIRWRMDPFLVAQKTFVLKGKLAYEGQLIAAVVNTHPKVNGPLRYRYTGKPGSPERGVVVSGSLKKNPGEVLEIDGTVGSWATHKKADAGGGLTDQWLRDPDQMLSYRGARQWARRHMPEAVLGVYSQDEIEGDVVDLDRQADGTYGPPPTPDARLGALAEKLKPAAPEPKVVEAKAEPVAEAKSEKPTKSSPGTTRSVDKCLHEDAVVVKLSTGAVVCKACGTVLQDAPKG